MKYVFLITLGLTPFLGAPAYSQTLSFDELAKKVLTKNSTLEISRVGVDQQLTKVEAAKWAMAPKISLGSSRVFRGNASDSYSAETSTNINASINLFDGLASWYNVKSSKLLSEVVRSDERSARLDILSGFAANYLDWQRASRKLAIVEKLNKMRDKMVHNIRDSVETGSRSNVDKLLFENVLLQANERLVRVEIEFKQAVFAIRKLLNDAENDDLNNRTPQSDSIFVNEYCNEAFDFQNHPVVSSLSGEVEALSFQEEAVTGSLFPSIDLGAEKQIESLSSTGEVGGESVRLTLTWPLFTGLSTKYERSNLTYEIRKTQIQKDAAITELKLINSQNCQQLSMITDLKHRSMKIANNLEELLNTSRIQYRNGGISAIDLTDQELRFLDAELSVIDAEFAEQEILASQWILHSGTLNDLNRGGSNE